MKVLLVSEGKHEQGGALESLVMRVQPHISQCTQDRISRSDLARLHGKGRGFEKRAVRWMIEARKRGFDALVLITDEDGHHDRIKEFDVAQSETDVSKSFPRALGIAIRAFDAWMLADEMALTGVLGFNVATQPAPEENHHPKESCADLLASSICGLGQSELYARIAQSLNVTLLEGRCRKGFGTFAERLRRLAQ